MTCDEFAPLLPSLREGSLPQRRRRPFASISTPAAAAVRRFSRPGSFRNSWMLHAGSGPGRSFLEASANAFSRAPDRNRRLPCGGRGGLRLCGRRPRRS